MSQRRTKCFPFCGMTTTSHCFRESLAKSLRTICRKRLFQPGCRLKLRDGTQSGWRFLCGFRREQAATNNGEPGSSLVIGVDIGGTKVAAAWGTLTAGQSSKVRDVSV